MHCIGQDPQSVPKPFSDKYIFKDEQCNPEYYEELLFMNGKVPIVSNKSIDKSSEYNKPTNSVMGGTVSDEYEEIQIKEAMYQNQSVINAVRCVKGKTKLNDYENVEYLNGKIVRCSDGGLTKQSTQSEDMYAIARRFPSFRIMNSDKKRAKRANVHAKNNKTSQKSVLHTINPCNSVANKRVKDPVYSRPKKWNFISRRNLKESHLVAEDVKNTIESPSSGR